MARPSATKLLTTQITDFLGVEVLTAQGLWAVLYKNEPINVMNKYWTANGEFKKYTRTTYPSVKPAENLAEKLNTIFNCKDFTVEKIL